MSWRDAIAKAARDPGRRAMLAQQMRDLENARNASQTYNYVITDPSKIDVMAKYGIVGGAPAGMGAIAAQDRYGEQ